MGELGRFFVSPQQICGEKATITGQDARHAGHVLRAKKGDSLVLFDGGGMEYVGVVEEISAKQISLRVAAKRPGLCESPLRLDLAQALLKASKMDKLLRSVTETGIRGWVPFVSRRSVPRLKDSGQRNPRWETIAAEAAKQCNRACLPVLSPPVTLEEMAAAPGPYDLKIVFWENSPTPFYDIVQRLESRPKSVLAALGPEGGFEDQEIELLVRSGFVHAGLGPRILRAETASIAACCLVQHHLGDMGGPFTRR